MKILKLIGLFAVLINFSAFGQTTENTSNKEYVNGWKSHSENNYSISYPENWELNLSGQMGVSFILFSPISSKEDQFRENVNLLIQDLAGYNVDLDQYVEVSKGQIKTIITDGKLLESKRIKGGLLDYHKVIYTGKQGIYKLKFEQYFWVENDKAFVLTLTCEESQFDSFKSIGESILNSFQLELN